MLSAWKHSGFNVFCGNRISPTDDTAMENLARYIIRASFSQERMQYLDQEGTVVYTSKDGATTKNFPALEWLAAMCSHIPNRGEQMVRYYGLCKALHNPYYAEFKIMLSNLDNGSIQPIEPCLTQHNKSTKNHRLSRKARIESFAW